MKLADSATAVKVNVKKGIETSERVEIISPVFSAEDKFLLIRQLWPWRYRESKNHSALKTMKSFFLTYKNPVAVILVLIVGGGLFAYSKMQTALFPEISFPKIKIIADAGLQPVNKMMITGNQAPGKCH